MALKCFYMHPCPASLLRPNTMYWKKIFLKKNLKKYTVKSIKMTKVPLRHKKKLNVFHSSVALLMQQNYKLTLKHRVVTWVKNSFWGLEQGSLDAEICISLRGWFWILLKNSETIPSKCWTVSKLQRIYILNRVIVSLK